MPSTRDIRRRIRSVKNTAQITKAMQMVAASKLRRAQVAAEAARPFAERMGKVLGSIASAVAGSDSAPKLLAGTGANRVHLLVVCTAERGLCGPFNSSIVRLAREKVNALINDGKEVKILCVGRKGQEQLRRLYGKLIIETIELRGVRTIGFEQAEMIAKKIIALFDQGAFDVCTLFFSRFRSVIAQIPTAQQIIPPVFENDAETGAFSNPAFTDREHPAVRDLAGGSYDYPVVHPSTIVLFGVRAIQPAARMPGGDGRMRTLSDVLPSHE